MESTPSGRPDILYFLPYLYGIADRMISINTRKTDKFINVTSVVPSDFSDEFGEFAETLMNE